MITPNTFRRNSLQISDIIRWQELIYIKNFKDLAFLDKYQLEICYKT